MNRPASFALIVLALALAACDRDPTAPGAHPPAPATEPIPRPSAAVTVVPGSVASMQALGLAPGFAFARTSDVNDADVLVGQLCPTSSTPTFNGCVPARWTNLVATPLPLPEGATGGTATAINASGVAVGHFYYQVTIDGTTRYASRAVRWQPGAAAPDLLPALRPDRPQPTETATDINDQGYVLGRAGSENATPPAVWSPSGGGTTLTLLRGVSDGAIGANAINNAGVIVGYRMTLAGSIPVRWVSSTAAPEDLPLPEGYQKGEAEDVADDGTILGRIDGTSSDVAVWRPGATEMEVTVLPRLEPQRPCYPGAIGGSGWIVGSCVTAAVIWARGLVYALAPFPYDDPPQGISRSGLIATDLRQSIAPYVRQLLADPLLIAHPGDSYAGAEGAAVAFNGTGSSGWPAGSTLNYEWNFGDGTTGTGATPSHTYVHNGTYTVTLRVSTGSGLPSPLMSTRATISNVAPTVDAGADATIDEGQTYTLNGTFSDPGAADNPWSYSINWGDGSAQASGSTATQQPISATHLYSKAGTFTVALTVRDKDFASTSDNLVLTVRAVKPVANAGGPYAAVEGSPVAFDGGASTDPNGDALTYSWSFGDGTTGTGPTPSHTYADNGTYPVTLTVDDGNGHTHTASTTATISNATPVVNAGDDASVTPGQSFTLSGRFTDAGAADGPWSFTINWGDGITSTGSRTSPGAISASHVYSAQGSYTVTLSVRDKNGATGSDNLLLTVRAVTPTARPGGPYTGMEGTALTFNGSASTDPNGDALTYAWSFGDGATGTGATPQHTYENPGIYPVTLTVNDGNGHTHTATTTATITDVPPRITGITTLPAEPVPLGTTVSVQVAFSGAAVDGFTAEVFWDDGTPSLPSPVRLSGFSAAHTYTTPGVYTVRVRVTDTDGKVAEQAAASYVVVYDPSTSSFVAGSGSIDSPAGAMPANPGAAGRAAFGFQSRYVNGAQAPSGFTRFEFRAGGLEFEATRFDWLVVAGTRAQFKGEGRIAGRAGTFQFMVSAVDDAPGTDRFRVKITDAAGNVVYDNQQGASENAQPATGITSGNITVQS